MKQAQVNPSPPVQEALPMQMDVRIQSLSPGSAILATASVNLNGCFAVRGIRIMNGSNGPFVSMPSYKTGNAYKDICFPCTKEFHQQFQQSILTAYQQALTQQYVQQQSAQQGQYPQQQYVQQPTPAQPTAQQAQYPQYSRQQSPLEPTNTQFPQRQAAPVQPTAQQTQYPQQPSMYGPKMFM